MGFMTRYMKGLDEFDYRTPPFEVMAYSLSAHFSGQGAEVDIGRYVKQNL